MMRWAGWWWDDAVREAHARATLTGKRQRVTRSRHDAEGMWLVSEVSGVRR